MITRTSRRALACALFATTSILALGSTPAAAQVTSPGTVYKQIDENGVDVTQLVFDLNIPAGSIGQGEAMIQMDWAGRNTIQAFFNRRESGTNAIIDLTFGDRKETFTGAKTATSFTSAQGSGATLTKISAQEYRHKTADGVETSYKWPSGMVYKNGGTLFCASGQQSNCDLLAETTRVPTGNTLTYGWTATEFCRFVTEIPQEVYNCSHYYRLASVSNSFGYRISFTYESDTFPLGGAPLPSWYKRTGATFWNGQNQVAAASAAFPATGVTDYTDIGGRTWRATNSTNYFGLRRPGAASDTTAVTTSAGKVTQVIKDGVTTSYAHVDDFYSTRTATITNALGQATVVTSNLTLGRPTSIKDALNRTTSFTYDASGRLSRTTAPEGNYVDLAYDARGNVTTRTAVAKGGSGLANIVSSATYPSTCTNPVTCNQPIATINPRGQITDYTYDATHGSVLTATAPAPTTGAVRPQVRRSYTPVTVAGGAVTMLTGVSACQTLVTCTGTADETRASVAYDPNGNVTSRSRGDGTGALTAVDTMTYDLTGNLLTLDGPLSGTADTAHYRYNNGRDLIGAISPDPDGAGAMKRRAARTTYRSDGQVEKQERGTVLGSTDTDWAAFVSLEAVEAGYDANARAVTSKLTAGGTTHALTHTSYDALGRPQCSATRMNPAAFASLPASACTLGTQGSDGPDRIAKTVYNAAGEMTESRLAVGTADEAAERMLTYSTNGRLATFMDGESNLTTYEYDGHDRLLKTRMPLPTKGSNASSTTDYEQLSYDAASNVTSRRLRDGQSIAFTFDNLDRATLKDLPGSEPDVSYAFDNLSRLTSATQTGHALSFAYDALSRNLAQVGPQGTVAAQWDIAGRRTRLTYPGSGLFVDSDYLVTGETTKLRENGATSGVGVLATIAYDDLGRRTSLTRANGTAQMFGYDPVSRLASLTNDLTGTANDLSATFAYNPASQIASTVRTGDAYAWTGHANENKTGTANGLNQLTQIGPKSLSHDTKGNVTAFGTKAFYYSSENLLTAGPNATTLSYDPVMRLHQTVSGAATAKFVYDGLDRIAEYNAVNALQRRYVHGPAMDEPIVWYEGSGTTDRRFLGSDERGSIVSVTDSAGAVLGLNKYDEYGQPQSTNLGAFGYTGQAWLPTVGAWYYKARVYESELGRFLQTDPIGYESGVNLYAYVGNDPVNGTDPLGLQTAKELEDIILVIGRKLKHTVEYINTAIARPGTGRKPGSPGNTGDNDGGGKEPHDKEVTCPAVSRGNMGTKTENQLAMSRPGWQVINAYRSAEISSAHAEANFPRSELWNGRGDAWRHFRWSFSMARSMGSKPAAAFANAHEVSNPGPSAELAMDLHNNAMGRAFASAYPNLSPDDAADAALKSGCLQTLR